MGTVLFYAVFVTDKSLRGQQHADRNPCANPDAEIGESQEFPSLEVFLSDEWVVSRWTGRLLWEERAACFFIHWLCIQ